MTTTVNGAGPHGPAAPELTPPPSLADALNRVIGWLDAVRRQHPDASCLSSVRDGSTAHYLYGQDLHIVFGAAGGWAQLIRMFDGGRGLSAEARIALESVRVFTTKYRETILTQKPGTPISTLDGAELSSVHVTQIAYIVDFVDTVVRKNSAHRDPEPPVNLDEFTDDMLDALGLLESQLYRDLSEGRLKLYSRLHVAMELHTRAARVWPALTPQQCGRAAGILAVRTMAQIASEAES